MERKRLHMKPSIDHALNTLKSHAYLVSQLHTLADTSSKRHLHPENPILLSESTLSIPPPMLTQTTTHRQEDHHCRIFATTSSYLLVLNGLDQQDKMQNPNHSGSQCKLGCKYFLMNIFREAGDTPNAGRSAPTLPIAPLPRGLRILSHPPSTIPLPNCHSPCMAHDMSLGSASASPTRFRDSLAEHLEPTTRRAEEHRTSSLIKTQLYTEWADVRVRGSSNIGRNWEVPPQCQDRQRTDKNNATQDAVHAAAEALMHKLIPDHNLLSPLPSHSERVRLFHHFRHSHKWAFQRAAAFAVFLRGGTKNFDFANYCIIFDVRYRLRCGGNPRLAYSVLDVNIRPLADFLAENPSVQTVMAANKPALDDVIALRSNTIPDFGGFFPSVYYWQEYGGYFISHPTPIHHHPEID
ncbi:hypothetical protein PILCRDRAFT_15130, partial [Piloderma croceum F 1598]